MNLGESWIDVWLVGLGVFVVRATVLLAAAWLAAKLAKDASAAIRHLIWTSATAGILALPLLAILVPAWDLPVISAPHEREAPRVSELRSAAQASPASESGTLRSEGSEELGPPRPPADAFGAAGVLVFVWLGVGGLLLVRLTIATFRVNGGRRSCRTVEDEGWLMLLRRLSRQHGVERPVALLESAEAEVPMTWGVVYPVILLPADAEIWDEEQRIAVLTHELAHVKRFDVLTQLIGQLAFAALWFHPLMWMALRRMRLEREHACDDFVLMAGVRASQYADGLLEFARNLKRTNDAEAAVLAMARRSELEGRLLAILDPTANRTTVRRARVVMAALVVLLLATPLAALRAARRMPTEEPAREAIRSPATDVQTLIDVTRAAKRITSDSEKGQLMASVAKAYLPDDELRDAYLETVSTMTSDHERTKALIALLDRESLPLSSTAQLLKSASAMTSDFSKRQVLERIGPSSLLDTAVQRAYLEVLDAMTSDAERAQAISALIERGTLSTELRLTSLQATRGITSDAEKARVLLLFFERQGLQDEGLRQTFLDVAETLSSDHERRRVMTAVMEQ